MLRISLVMATVGRTHELERFLAALDSQPYRNIELIVVDQNNDSRLTPVLGPYSQRFPILHLRSAPGLSRARNIGLAHISGDIVGFPDDDCWYRRDTLPCVAELLGNGRFEGVSGRLVNERGCDRGTARFDAEEGLLTLSNLWRRVNSSTLFVTRRLIQSVGGFDEDLGLGADTPWAGAEDIDYPARAIKAGFLLYYSPSLCVTSPDENTGDGAGTLRRAYSYGAGMGRVWRKHRFPLSTVLYYLARPLAGSVANLLVGQRLQAGYYWSAFRGRLFGWLSC